MTTQQKIQYDWKKKFLPWSLKATMKGMGKGVLTVNEQSLIFAPEKGGEIAGADVHSIRALRAYKLNPAEPAFASFVPQGWDLQYMDKYMQENIHFRELESNDPDDYMKYRGCKTDLEKLQRLADNALDPNLPNPDSIDDEEFNWLTGPFNWPRLGTAPDGVKNIARGFMKYDAEAVEKIVTSPPFSSATNISSDEYDFGTLELARFLICIVYLKCLAEWREMPSLGLDVAYSYQGEIKNISFTIEDGQISEFGTKASAYSFTRRILGLNPDVSIVGERTMKPEAFYQHVERWRELLGKLSHDGKEEYVTKINRIWNHLNSSRSESRSLIQDIWACVMAYETHKRNIEVDDRYEDDPMDGRRRDYMEKEAENLKRVGL